MAQRTIFREISASNTLIIIEEMYNVKVPQYRLWVRFYYHKLHSIFREYRYLGRVVKLAMQYADANTTLKLQALWEQHKAKKR